MRCAVFNIHKPVPPSDLRLPSPKRLIRNPAKPDSSPCGQPAAVQNATRLVELPTKWFEATYSIQLSYGCVAGRDYIEVSLGGHLVNPLRTSAPPPQPL